MAVIPLSDGSTLFGSNWGQVANGGVRDSVIGVIGGSSNEASGAAWVEVGSFLPTDPNTFGESGSEAFGTTANFVKSYQVKWKTKTTDDAGYVSSTGKTVTISTPYVQTDYGTTVNVGSFMQFKAYGKIQDGSEGWTRIDEVRSGAAAVVLGSDSKVRTGGSANYRTIVENFGLSGVQYNYIQERPW